MSYGISPFGPLLFGWFRNVLSTVSLADGRTASTYRSNIQAFLDFLNQAIVTPVNNRNTGSSLAAV